MVHGNKVDKTWIVLVELGRLLLILGTGLKNS